MNLDVISKPGSYRKACHHLALHLSKYPIFVVTSIIKYCLCMLKTALFSPVFPRAQLMQQFLRILPSTFSSIVGNGQRQSLFLL